MPWPRANEALGGQDAEGGGGVPSGAHGLEAVWCPGHRWFTSNKPEDRMTTHSAWQGHQKNQRPVFSELVLPAIRKGDAQAYVTGPGTVTAPHAGCSESQCTRGASHSAPKVAPILPTLRSRERRMFSGPWTPRENLVITKFFRLFVFVDFLN